MNEKSEDEIERWADDHFSQGEVAVVMDLVKDHNWGPLPPIPEEIQSALQQARLMTKVPRHTLGNLGEAGDREYARGVRNALLWVTGKTELKPFEEEEDEDNN